MNENIIEIVSERAAIIEYDGNISRYHAERMAADLYRLTREQREAIFPMPRLISFEAVLFMAKLGFRFMPSVEKNGKPVPVFKWVGEYQKNFTNDIDQLLKWQAQDYKRFFYLPGLSGFIGFDIDRNHADCKDGLIGFYEIMRNLAGKPPERLPYYLRDIPHSFPCYTETPSGGWHLLFKFSGQCKTTNLTYEEHNLEIKYLNSGLSLGEKPNGVYAIRGNPMDAPELPPFLVELINPQPKPVPQPVRYQGKNKPGLEKILDRVLAESAGHNDAQKKFAWRAAYFGHGLGEVLDFVKSRPDTFGNDTDTETVVNHAWASNMARAAS
ncbi:MAG: bifunctional DNA primase/polymerase [Treponema sp.]|nr:bifunctional DNA primase/polymerase [Treponema sp.]